MSTRRRFVLLLLAFALVALLPVAPASARSIALEQSGELHRTSFKKRVHFFEGTATGTLPGKVSAALKIDLFAVSGVVTFYPRGGSISLDVTGKPRGLRRVSGTMKVIAGTGKFAKARGEAGFSGTLNRRTWRASVTASGRLTY